MNQWVTVKEAADILGTTERTIYRQMKAGKIASRLDNDRRLVAINCHDVVLTPEARHAEQIEHLKELLSEKDARIEQLENQIEHLTQLFAMSQKNISQLTEQNQLLLEDLRPKRRWYHRLLVWNSA
jgi:excisionase family DNA binding protein